MALVAVKIKWGSQFSIYVLELEKECELLEFLQHLDKRHPVEWDRINRYLERTKDHGLITNVEIFKPIGDKLYEFRTYGGVRIFAFLDAGKIMICTNGYVKKKTKLDPREVAKARNLRERYFNAKLNNTLRFEEMPI